MLKETIGNKLETTESQTRNTSTGILQQQMVETTEDNY
jgi:hypothetical protein